MGIALSQLDLNGNCFKSTQRILVKRIRELEYKYIIYYKYEIFNYL